MNKRQILLVSIGSVIVFAAVMGICLLGRRTEAGDATRLAADAALVNSVATQTGVAGSVETAVAQAAITQTNDA